jgi:3-oxoacyl-[acyl-carrier protein] reductase
MDPMEQALEQLLAEVAEVTEPQPAPAYGELRGRCALITGGCTGIGRAVALELGRQGVHIAFNYLADEHGRAQEEAERTASELRQMEVNVFWRACDVRDSAAVERFVADSLEALGGLHFLVNNAGITRDGALWQMTDDQWRDVLDTNLTGAFHLTRAVAPTFRAQQFGKIVNISSIHGVRAEFGLANYSASKAGLLGLTRSAAVELGPSNVNVNALAPGYIRTTQLLSNVPVDALDQARERSALGRLGDPQDVANIVVFLCSELARHVTGAIIPVDGGHHL